MRGGRIAGLVVAVTLALLLLPPSGSAQLWEVETADADGDTGRFSSLTVDSSGVARIAYQDWTHQLLRQATRDGAGWTRTTLDALGDTGWHVSSDLDGSARSSVAYQSLQPVGLRFTRQDGDGWMREPVPLTEGGGTYTSICVSPNGAPHISFHDASQGWTQYATRSITGVWSGTTIELDAGPAGGPTSIAWSEEDGACRVAYYKEGVGLRHADQVAPAWSVTETVDTVEMAGRWCSLAVGEDGASRIAYASTYHGYELRYAERLAGSWRILQVDGAGTGGAGSFASLDLGPGDLPRIAYTNDARSELRLAVREGSGWEISLVDEGGPFWDLSLASDRDGFLQVAYYDASRGDLKLARQVRPPDLGVRLVMPGLRFSPGEPCGLTARLYNAPGPSLEDVPLAVLLDVGGVYWFYPSWKQELDLERVRVPHPYSELTIIPTFPWPDTGGSSAAGIVFWGALLDDSLTAIRGGADAIGHWEFRYGP